MLTRAYSCSKLVTLPEQLLDLQMNEFPWNESFDSLGVLMYLWLIWPQTLHHLSKSSLEMLRHIWSVSGSWRSCAGGPSDGRMVMFLVHTYILVSSVHPGDSFHLFCWILFFPTVCVFLFLDVFPHFGRVCSPLAFWKRCIGNNFF